jgi:hypothetical protein
MSASRSQLNLGAGLLADEGEPRMSPPAGARSDLRGGSLLRAESIIEADEAPAPAGAERRIGR